MISSEQFDKEIELIIKNAIGKTLVMAIIVRWHVFLKMPEERQNCW